MAKDSKTSKTARVMNLLSKKPDPAAAEEQPTGAPAAPAAPTPPPIVTSMAPDAAVSSQIKDALENALEGELTGQSPAPAEPEPQPEPAPAKAEAPLPAADTATASEPEKAAEPASTVDLNAPAQWKEPLVPNSPGYINVMQALVEEKAPRYVKMFGLCSCERCLDDVKAYTLNHLPSKYVVLEAGDRIPRLTVYEGKFASDITAQLLQACKVVMARPHHSR